MHLRARAIRLLLLISVFSTLLVSAPLLASETTVRLPMSEAWSSESVSGRWLAEVVAAPDLDRGLRPCLTWWWALEDGEHLADVQLIALREEAVAHLERQPRRSPLIGIDGSPTREGLDALDEPLWSPDYSITVSPPRALHGRVFQSITIEALRGEGESLFGLKEAELRLRTAPDTEQRDIVRPLRPDFPLRERVLASLGKSLLNLDLLPGDPDRAVGGGDFPTDVPNIESAAVEMVIVTVDSLVDLCEGYALFKTNSGLPTVVRSLEWMEEHYAFGSDRPELVRNFLIDAYSKWSIRYVLLVGDSNEIPPRYAHSEIFDGGADAPTDLYFACLDGDWNANHNSIWAEAADSTAGDEGDRTDLLAELSVGRLPASNRADCTVLLEKSRYSQHNTLTPFQDRFLMLGEVLFPTDYPTDPNILIDGAAYCESIYVNYTGPEQSVVRLYENYTEYPGALPLSVEATWDSLNNGWGTVLHNGHGSRQSMSVGDGSIGAYIVSHLDNGERTFLLYMVNCTAAAFDFNCISEIFLSNPDGGAHAVIGSTGLTFANVSVKYMNHFFDILYNGDRVLRLGDIYRAGLNIMEPNTSEDNGYRWAHTTFTLLADPSNWHHYRAVDIPQVTFPDDHELGLAPAVFHVEDEGGLPLENVLVAIRKASEDYQYGLTNAAGDISFELRAETVGEYSYYVGGRDLRSDAGRFFCVLPAAAAPLLTLESVSIDDLTGGDVLGNGNGVAERGEIVRLTLSMQNRGAADAQNVSCQLSSANPLLMILDDAAVYGDLPAGSGGAVGDDYLVEIGEVADDEILAFSLAITSDQGVVTDDFFLEAAVPVYALYRTVLDDLSGGDGDGLLEEGETAFLSLSLHNSGRGWGQGVEAALEALDGSSLLVLQGVSSLGDLSPLSTGQGPALFELQREAGESTGLRLILSDVFGHADSLDFDLAIPVDCAEQITFIPLADATRMKINWEPVEMEGAAYVVLRATDAAGPYEEVSEHWLFHGCYEDSELDPYTSYWYRIGCLSPAGIFAASSDSAMVTTSPAQRAGWPVVCGKELAGTPVAADVDGDGALEIIVGAEVVYGFNLDGSELFDGDGDYRTIGPIDDEGSNFFCSLTASDLDRDGGIEVLACSWDTGDVFLYTFEDTPGGATASMMPGWPRECLNGFGMWASPVMGDVDGDGFKEIFLSDVGGNLMAWNWDGSEVIDGDSNPGTDGVFATGHFGWTRSSAAVADVDGDEVMEIFIGTGDGYLRAYRGDGSSLQGFPFHAGEAIWSSPAIGDIDDDGLMEIVFAAENDSLYVLRADGSLQSGWPIHLINDNWALCPSPALADITGDGRLEIFACSIDDYDLMEVGWLDYTGAWLTGWPRLAAFSTQSSPVVGDLDGDGDLEVVLGNEFASIEAWHHDGEPVNGFPLVTGDYVRATPTLVDLDGDGTLEMLLAGWDKNVYIWQFPVPFVDDNTPWYTFQHDQARSGNYGTVDWVVGVDDEALQVPGLVRLDANYPNPFNPKTNIRFSIGGAADTHVRLMVHDVRGRKVRSLLNETLQPGTYARSWDGRDDSGHALASGIYFARIEVGEKVDSRKMTLLK